MAPNLNLKKDIESSIRDYWEIIYKRKFLFGGVFLLVSIIGSLYVMFILHVSYKATATVIFSPPAVTIVKERGAFIREYYDVTNEVEMLQSDGIISKTTELLRRNEKLDVLPDEIKSMLEVYQRLKTQIVDMSAVSTDPQKAFLVLKNIIAAYLEDAKERRAKTIKDFYEDLNKRINEKRKEVEEAENKVTKFLMDNEIIASALEVGTSEIETTDADKAILIKEPQINEKYLMLKAQRIDKENFMNEVKSYRNEDNLTALAIIAKREPNQVDLTLRDTLYEKERELAKLLVTQSEIHPNVIAAKGEANEAKKKIAVEVDRAIQSLELNVKSLKLEEEKLHKIISVGLSDKMVEYNTLKRDLDVKKSLYANFLEEIQMLNVVEKLQNIPFLRVSKIPLLPTAPIINKPTYIFLVFLLSFALASFLVYVIENINVSIENVEEIEDALGLTVLATIPVWKKKQDTPEQREGRRDVGLVTARHPNSGVSEAFKMLKTNIHFIGENKRMKSLVITSPTSGEGKSFVSSNLAVVMAATGKKVVLIDADLRKPKIHRYFNLENIHGLSDFLRSSENNNLTQIYDTDFENLKVIPSGPIPPNPNELLATRKMHELIVKLSETQDTVIIDSPPVLAVSDSLILSAKADGTIFVIFANSTSRRSASRAKVLLQNAGVNILGSVLNGVQGNEAGYYYYGSDYYHNET